MNPGNVRPLVAELLNFLSTADVARSRTRPTPESGGGAPGRRAPGDRRGTGQEFKEDLTSKICALVAKQAPPPPPSPPVLTGHVSSLAPY